MGSIVMEQFIYNQVNYNPHYSITWLAIPLTTKCQLPILLEGGSMFYWTPALAVGVELIDQQHQALFRAFEALVLAMNEGKGKVEIERTLDFLEDYVRAHFEEEERILEEREYEGLHEQRYQHRTFCQQLEETRRNFERDGASSVLAIHIQQKLAGWLINHISKLDRIAFQ